VLFASGERSGAGHVRNLPFLWALFWRKCASKAQKNAPTSCADRATSVFLKQRILNLRFTPKIVHVAITPLALLAVITLFSAVG
jgi:hypothetical protein